MLFDSGRQQVFASRYAHDAFGMSLDSLAGTGNFWTRVTPREGQRGQAALDSALAGKPAFAAFSARNAAGEERQLEGTFFGIGDGAGAIMRDVTVERELAAQVSRARQVETLGTLAGGVAHDFNNLLTAILGNIYLARETLAENSDAVSLLDDAKTAGERGAELVRRLLDYGRPAVEHNELIPLGKLVSETIALASPGLTPKIELVTDAETCAERRVTGDFAALQQVLLNLLVNARDAMSEGGRICITVTECHPDVGVAAARRYGIAVSDTGCGIAPDIIGRIFDPFFTTKGIGKGTGLGLATAMSIMRAHGGTILVESSPEAGSTFRMILPAGEPVEAAA
jgi:signal transduction histidine kinase